MRKYFQCGDRTHIATQYTDFLKEAKLDQAFWESGFSSPKNFVRERHMNAWLAYQVIKRMEQ